MPRKQLYPVRPSPALEAEYFRKLDTLIDEMRHSVLYWLKAAWRSNEPVLAQDATPSDTLRRAIARLRAYWFRRFNIASRQLAGYFMLNVHKRSDVALRRILRQGGFSVRFQQTQAMRDVTQAIVHENVSLIRSIPQQLLNQVEGHVMRSVQAGRKLDQLTDILEAQFGVTRSRARLIARDQNNKATGALQRVRLQENGFKQAIWVHSGGGKTPRPAHVKAGADRVKFDLDKGWFDPHEKQWILPGQLINCRCVMRPVVPGFS